ncbi:hypothetical protein OK351_03405 [Glutamicibacter sp. MNS18]|uniref:hypothetical protein n=1 Tax=Glutamicibacter sp. MNS18 TaxID=2989817 RepID=UPI002235C9DD|nr:hypothetical protein [Glutamicibacter sp. MNS18]MCW4464553.1 hypothetical protein [Glutamicibacter sp. MNS18]
MEEHRVRIGLLDTQLLTVGTGRTLPHALGDSLNSGLLTLLPGMLEPILDPHHGVIRIKSLSLAVSAAGTADPAHLATLLAEAITRGVDQALALHTPMLVAWPTRESYLAHYVRYRWGERRFPAWCFEEFAALDELTPAQVLTHLVGSDPGLLRVLAAEDPRARTLSLLAGEDCRQLLAELLREPAGTLAVPHLLPGQLTLRITGTAPGVLARHTLELLFGVLARQPSTVPCAPADLLPAVMAVVALAALLTRDPPLPTASPDPPVDPVDRYLHRIGDLPAAFRQALRRAGSTPALRQLLQRQLRQVRDQHTHGSQSDSAPAHAPLPGPPTWTSPRAGCALLLPSLVGHGFHELLDTRQLNQLVVGTLEPGDRNTAGSDPLLTALIPADPRQPASPWPPIPARLVERVHPDARAVAGLPGAGGWSGLLLALFASGLPGLRHSSADYLRRQFLAVPGTLRLTDHEATVELVGPDLAVVLAMGGLQGPQLPIPWLAGRRLQLILGGLRP